MIQRYEPAIFTTSGMSVNEVVPITMKSDDGDYVLYTDHLAAIDEKDKEIERWVALYRKQSTEIEQLKHKIYILQLPYQVNKANLAEHISECRKEDGDGR